MRASETGIIAADEPAAAKAEMTAEQYATEFECSFDSAVVGAYYGQDLNSRDTRSVSAWWRMTPHCPS